MSYPTDPDGVRVVLGAPQLAAVLAGARSGEVRGATWDEFDLDAGIWTVPGERTKAKEPHRVPPSLPALALVKRLKEQKQHEILMFPVTARRGAVRYDLDCAAAPRESEE